jgi:phosphoribosylanthranilate isomerase
MDKFLIKICGLSDEASVQAAVDAGADMLGFTFFPASPRNIEPARAGQLATAIRGNAKIVALFVNPTDDELAHVMTELRPDIIQLHGSERPAAARDIGKKFGCQVYKALGIREKADLSAASDYVSYVDGLLFDAKPPKGANRPGGLGTTFDWSVLDDFQLQLPTLLSGGLNPENVAEAVESTHLSGLDVSSGVESAPGQKSPAMIKDFIHRARAAHAAKPS